ncbi:MAG: NmrA family NAD(P)-binding protein [Solirubrobacterales bacterium]|nr:NmrA family NAD(P)-binding protein [Solirubrobacterales bacterium]
MIVVTGATGNFGSHVVDCLLKRIPPDQIGVSVRDPSRAQSLQARGVRVRSGDFSDPPSLGAAFEDASQVLVVSVDKLGAEGVAQSTAAIDAAYAAGARRVLYTSHQAASADSLFAPARDHAAVEAHLAAQGKPYVALRNGYYTSSLLFHVGNATETGELRTPASGPTAWTSREDLGEAAAALLAGANQDDGPTPPLTSPKAISLEEVAAILSQATGRSIRHVVVDDESYVAGLISGGLPAPFARVFLDTFRAARCGEFAVSDPALATLLGREPQSVRAGLQAALKVGPQPATAC